MCQSPNIAQQFQMFCFNLGSEKCMTEIFIPKYVKMLISQENFKDNQNQWASDLVGQKSIALCLQKQYPQWCPKAVSASTFQRPVPTFTKG